MFALLAISSAFAVGGRRYLYDCVSVLGITLILPIVTTIALPRFTPTLMRFRIRSDQLLRVTAYGTAGMIWTGILFVSATLPLILVNLTRGGPWRQGLCVNLEQFLGTVLLGYGLWGDPVLACLNTGLGALLLALSFLWWWRFLYVALRSYLRTDASNALALFLSTQAIGTLVLLWWVLNFTVPHSRALVRGLARLERLLH